jgi:hypothetical protein
MAKKKLSPEEEYVTRSIESQRRLGYRSRVSRDVVDEAVQETARVVARLKRVAKR